MKVFGNLRSIQLRAGRDVVVHHKKMEFFLIAVLLVVHSGQQHATEVDAHHLPRREIRDRDQGLSDQLFRLIVSVNTGEDHAIRAAFLFRIVPCDDLLSFISEYKRPGGKCRILSCQNS